VLEHAQRINELAREAAEKNAIQTQIDGPLPYREKPSFKAANSPSSPDAFPNTPHDPVIHA
jgi:hypothetical protein